MIRSAVSIVSIFLAFSLLSSCKTRDGAIDSGQSGVKEVTEAPSGGKPDHRTIYAIVTPTSQIKKFRDGCGSKINADQPDLPEGNMKWEAVELCVQERRMESFCWSVYDAMQEGNMKYDAVQTCLASVKKRYEDADTTMVYEEVYDQAAKFISPDCATAGSESQANRSASQTRNACLIKARIENLCNLVTIHIADAGERASKLKICLMQVPYQRPF